ncbi:hypothetical protein BN946_scf185015.g90 [Trametes cinnabarina]|uniref:Pentacotripeptide-repeat region of PRORP domain-containing protein n=1 Tax=Pycnoporus cinnabarinus TaxID=5643 RepID=A0A060SGZ0_PYCCI|nr:hypothetical protein BN946_scf185015.g90 [Trametes cinnabarina]
MWLHYGQPPGPPSATLAFLANLILSVMREEDGVLSQDLLQRWGNRLQSALRHIDPGIQDMPSNLVRVRWNGLFVASMALLGKLDDTMDGCSVLFHQDDPKHKSTLRGHILQVYTIVALSVFHYHGAAAVLDFLIEHPWVDKYFTAEPNSPALVPDIKRFARTVLPLLSGITDPVGHLQEARTIRSDRQLSAMGSILIRVAARTGRDPYPILEFLQRHKIFVPDEVVFMVIKELARANSFDLASQLLERYSPEVVTPKGERRPRPGFHATGLFLASRRGDVAAAEKYYSFLSKRSQADADDKASYMHAYAVASQASKAAKLFDEFFPAGDNPRSKHEHPNIVHYTTIIFAYAQVGDLESVNLWLGKLSHAGFRPDVHVYSIILQTLAQRGDIESMSSVLDQMRRSKVSLTAVPYTTLITILGKRQDPHGAERIYKRAIDEGVVPDREMVTSIMNAHVESGSWQGAIRAFDYLMTPGRPGAALTIEVFNTLMKAYVLIAAPFRIVAHLFRQLGKVNLRPDARTFALLIQSACDSGFMDISEDLYKEMERLATEDKQTSLKANVHVLTIIMRGYLLTGRRLKAKGVMDRMKALGVEPNAITYAHIMKAYAEQTTSEGAQVAENLLRSLMRDEKRPWLQLERGRRLALETVYRPLLNAYAKRELVYDVERIHREMMDAGGEPTLGTLTALLDAYRRTGNIEGVRSIWPEIRRLGHEYTRHNSLLTSGQSSGPSLSGLGIIMCIPLSIYVDALSVAGEHGEVALVWKMLKDEGLQFDSHNWNHLVVALVRAGEPHRAFDIVENVILRYQAQARAQYGRGRDMHPSSPLSLDLPPPEEGDLPTPRPEAPLHNAPRRAQLSERTTKRMRNMTSIEERGSQDFAHPLLMLQQLSPLWNTWRPHGATLTLLGQVLDHLRSGRLVQPVRPNADAAFEQAALDATEMKLRTEAAGIVLGGIYDAFPRTVQLIAEYEIMKRSSQRGMQQDSS